MSRGMVTAAGGLTAEDRAKIVSENIRAGVVLFKGTSNEVLGKLGFPNYYITASTRNDGQKVVVVAAAYTDGRGQSDSGFDLWVPTPTVTLPKGKYRAVYDIVSNANLNQPLALALEGADRPNITFPLESGTEEEFTVEKSATVKISSHLAIFPTGTGSAIIRVGFYKEDDM